MVNESAATNKRESREFFSTSENETTASLVALNQRPVYSNSLAQFPLARFTSQTLSVSRELPRACISDDMNVKREEKEKLGAGEKFLSYNTILVDDGDDWNLKKPRNRD